MADTPSPTSSEYEGGPLEAILVWKLRWLRPALMGICVGLGIAVTLSAVVVGGLAARSGEMLLALFEALTAVAGVFASLVCLGKFREGAGIAMASCALAIGGSAVLSEPALISMLFNTRVDPLVIGGLEIKWIMAAHVIVAVLMLMCAGVIIWARNPRPSAWFLVRAVVLSMPLVLAAGAYAAPPVRAWIDTLPALIRVIGVVAGFFAGLALISAAGHCFIRSLEMGKLNGVLGPDAAPQGSPRAAA